MPVACRHGASIPRGGWRRATGFLFPAAVLAALLTACGPVPRPFEPGNVDALASDRKVLSPVTVTPIAGQPGLAEALAHALDDQDIAATTRRLSHFFQVTGQVDTGGPDPSIVWRLTDDSGHVFEEIRQHLGNDVQAEAAEAAELIEALLRGLDSGLDDLASGPHVFFQGLSAPRNIDGQSVARAMGHALEGAGMTIDTKSPAFLIAGHMKVTPAAEGQDLVALEWVVKSPDGKELGRVNQASPVARGVLLGPLAALSRQIAEAGANGVAEVIRQKRAARP